MLGGVTPLLPDIGIRQLTTVGFAFLARFSNIVIAFKAVLLTCRAYCSVAGQPYIIMHGYA